MADPTREEIDAAKALLREQMAPKPPTAMELAAAELAAEKEATRAAELAAEAAAKKTVHDAAILAEAERYFALCAQDPRHYTARARAAFAAAGLQRDPRAVALRESVPMHRVLVSAEVPAVREIDRNGDERIVTPAVPAVYESISRAEMERRHAEAMRLKRAGGR